MENKRIDRYQLHGRIERKCEYCGEFKELLCFEDVLNKTQHKCCEDCLESEFGITLLRRRK